MPQLVTADAASGLLELVERLDAQQGFAEVVASLRGGHGATLDGVWGSSCAPVAAALSRHCPGPLVVVCPHPADIDTFVDDLSLFTATVPAMFPAWETSPGEGLIRDEVYGERLRLLKTLAAWTRGMACGAGVPPAPSSRDGRTTSTPALGATRKSSGKRPAAPTLDPQPSALNPSPSLIVTSVQSLLQPVPSPQALAEATRQLRRGDTIDLTELTSWLLERGFHSSSAVALPGEFSLRGGILDLFAPDWYDPVRIELFGDEIDSLRRFEVTSQRSLAALDEVEVTVLDATAAGKEHFVGYLPPTSWLLLAEPPEIEEEGRRYLQRSDQPDQYHSVAATLQQLLRFPSATAERIARGSLEINCHLRIESVERFSGDVHKVKSELDAAGHGQQVFVVCQTEAEATRLAELFADTQLSAEGRLHYPIGRMNAGFRLVPERIALVSGAELFHRHELARPASRRRLGRVIDSFLELREGDYVVHVGHGIGRYRGLRLLGEESLVEEHLELEFHGGTKIFVPASKINLVQKYVGGSKSRPTLARIGGRTWERHKQAAQNAVNDLAADMLDLQARRGTQPGISFPP